jgi:hypothetical protein
MTEQTLDALRPLAERMADEASRLQRALKGSSANEGTVREHMANVFDLVKKTALALDPDHGRVSVPVASYNPVKETRGKRRADVSV